MRIISASMCVMFCWFASLQFNDVDAWIWITTYGLVAALSAAAIVPSTRPRLRIPARTLATTCAVWGLYLLGQTTGKWWDGEIEREVGGLFISSLWCVTLDIFSTKMSRSD